MTAGGVRRALAVVVAWLAASTNAAAQTQTAVEYFHADWGYYFVTAFPAEQAVLDGGAFDGAWKRTGQAFTVWSTSQHGTSEVCRFFSTAFVPRSSHFYTPFPGECEAVRRNPDWQYEAISFHVRAPDATGTCPEGTVPLYRVYNEGQGGAPNHRYTISREIRNAMLAQGWSAEGSGDDIVFACVPSAAAGGTALEGIWSGTSDRNEALQAVVLDDGTFYLQRSRPGEPGTDAGIVHGRMSLAGSAIASRDAKHYPVAAQAETDDVVVPVSLSGTIEADDALSLTVDDGSGERHMTLARVPGSRLPPQHAQGVGLYEGIAGHRDGRRRANFLVAANASLTGTNDVCTFSSTLVPRASVAAYDAMLSATSAASCRFGRGPVAGIAFHDPVRNKFYLLAPFENGGNLFYVIGTRR